MSLSLTTNACSMSYGYHPTRFVIGPVLFSSAILREEQQINTTMMLFFRHRNNFVLK